MVKKLLVKHQKLIIIVVTILFLLYYFLISPFFTIIKVTKSMQNKIVPMKSALSSRDMELLIFELEYFREDGEKLDNSINRLKYLQAFPYIGQYASDADVISSLTLRSTNIAIALLSSAGSSMPNVEYSFKGLGKEEDLMTESPAYGDFAAISEFIAKEFNVYRSDLVEIDADLSKIDPNRYPEEFNGIQIRDKIVQIQALFSDIIEAYDDIGSYTDLIAELFRQNLVAELLGDQEIKNYLILMQNSREIKPDGGPITVYAVLSVKKGNFKVTKSGDTIILDKSAGTNISNGNISEKFSESAKNISTEWYRATNIEPAGAIVVDTNFIASLVEILGSVKVSGTETITTENVYEQLDKFEQAAGSHSDANAIDKAQTSTFLYNLMSNALTTNAHKAELLKVITDNIKNGHIAIYINNERVQELLNQYGLAR